MRHRPKHVIEFLLLRATAWWYRILPYRAALFSAWLLALVAHYVFRFRAAEARRRIQSVMGPGFPASSVRKCAWISWRNLCFNTVEILRFPTMTPRWVEKHADPSLAEVLRARSRQERGCVISTMHMGNWDLAGLSGHLLELPIFFIARRQKNPLTDAYLNRMREASGTETLLNDDQIVREILRRLRKGKMVALLPDVRHRTPALSLQFLGGTANIAGGVALFARQNKTPILPFVARRIGWSRHEWTFLDPIPPNPELDKAADIERMTQTLLDRFSEEVLKTPEQYFLYNKRWVLDPLESTAREETLPPAQ